MKNVAAVMLTLLVMTGFVRAGSPVGVQVGTNSVVLLPDRTLQNAPVWVTLTAYGQGDYVKVGARYYMAIEAGTSGATAPSHALGTATDGTVTWLKVKPGLRQGLAIVNASTNAVYLSVASSAEEGKGIYLSGQGSAWEPNHTPQGRITAIAGSDSNLVTGVEW